MYEEETMNGKHLIRPVLRMRIVFKGGVSILIFSSQEIACEEDNVFFFIYKG